MLLSTFLTARRGQLELHVSSGAIPSSESATAALVLWTSTSTFVLAGVELSRDCHFA